MVGARAGAMKKRELVNGGVIASPVAPAMAVLSSRLAYRGDANANRGFHEASPKQPSEARAFRSTSSAPALRRVRHEVSRHASDHFGKGLASISSG